MSNTTHIEWTETTWNPSTGCTKISQGCKNCYAEKWAFMQQKRGIAQYTKGFNFRTAEKRLYEPLRWKTGKLVFVNSMSDLFHENMPLNYLKKVFYVMNITPQNTYQILTKRIEKVVDLASHFNWTENIWMGVSVEDNKTASRIETLKSIPAKNKFISFEPLLENIEFSNFQEINWIIVGGESGGKARKIEKDWVINIQKSCKTQSIPFFFKQWGKKEFNPDSNDPTIKREDINHARGGCHIDNKICRETPSFYGVTH